MRIIIIIRRLIRRRNMSIKSLQGRREWEYSRAVGMVMNFNWSSSTYHMRFCSVIRELGKHSHFTSARPSPGNVIVTSLMCTVNGFVCSFFSVLYYKSCLKVLLF